MMDSDHICSHGRTPVRVWPSLVAVTRQEEVERLGKEWLEDWQMLVDGGEQESVNRKAAWDAGVLGREREGEL